MRVIRARTIHFLKKFPLLFRLVIKLRHVVMIARSPKRDTMLVIPMSQIRNFEYRARVEEISQYLIPRRVLSGESLRRFGNLFDGGYVLLDDFRQSDSILSLGVGDDISFDADMAKLVSKIDFYDHTVPGLPQSINNARFYRERIGIQGSNETTLEEAVCRLETNNDLILKMDIEGAEWEVLGRTRILQKFRQIVIELHNLHFITNIDDHNRMVCALENISRTHTPISIHANNCGSITILGNCLLPNTIEVCFVRNEDYVFDSFEDTLCDSLHEANDPNAPDIALTFPITVKSATK
jgi:hypothetical protein